MPRAVGSDQILPAGTAPLPPPARPVNDNWGYLTRLMSVMRSRCLRIRRGGSVTSLKPCAPSRQRPSTGPRLGNGGRWTAIPTRSKARNTSFLSCSSTAPRGGSTIRPASSSPIRSPTASATNLSRRQPGPHRAALRLVPDARRRVDPWRPGVRLGAVPSADGLQIALGSNAAWRGRIVFDRPRHRDHLNLPYEYPRLNGWTEWFTADPEVSYEITLTSRAKQPKRRSSRGGI